MQRVLAVVVLLVAANAPTIQAGIDAALVGDVVELAAGTYHETGLVMKPCITLRGGEGAPDAVILDDQDAGRIMNVNALDGVDPTRIESLTFTRADSGAVFDQCTFVGNTGAGHLGMATSICSDRYASWEPGGALLAGGDDESNIHVDPCFCDRDHDDDHLAADSWCLPGVGPVVCEEQMGALGEGCAALGCPESPVSERSMGSVKGLFR